MATAKENKKKQLINLVLVVGGVFLFLFFYSKFTEKPTVNTVQTRSSVEFGGSLTPEQNEALVAQYDTKFTELSKRLSDMEAENKKLTQEREQEKKRELNNKNKKPYSTFGPDAYRPLPPLGEPPEPIKEIGKDGLLMPQADVQKTLPVTPSRTRINTRVEIPGVKKLNQKEEPPKLVSVVIKKPPKKTPEGEPRKTIYNTIPASTFVEAVMLNGLDAPTGDLGKRDPHPVVLQVTGFGNMANHFVHKIDMCRIGSAAYGELSDERVYMRTTNLSCVLKDGSIIKAEADGYIVSEDGKTGVPGILIEKQGALIGRAMLAGLFSGIGRSIGDSYGTTSSSALGTVTSVGGGDIAKAGAADGVGTAMEKVADWYIKRADDVFPVISVNGGRVVTIYFKDDVDLGANFYEENQPVAGSNDYMGD